MLGELRSIYWHKQSYNAANGSRISSNAHGSLAVRSVTIARALNKVDRLAGVGIDEFCHVRSAALVCGASEAIEHVRINLDILRSEQRPQSMLQWLRRLLEASSPLDKDFRWRGALLHQTKLRSSQAAR